MINLRASFRRIIDARKIQQREREKEFDEVFRAEHYQDLHDQFQPYIDNNWLVEDLDIITAITRKSVCEVGCGNGKFLRAASTQCDRIVGMDWAKSPQHKDNPENVTFIQADLSRGMPTEAGPYDLICSADFLEHLPQAAVEMLIADMHERAPVNYHKVACYDDGGSHRTLLSPQGWLKLFKKHSDRYQLVAVFDRRGNGQEVAVITNSVFV